MESVIYRPANKAIKSNDRALSAIMSPGSLENVFIDVEPGTISGLDLLGQVSSQLSRLHEVC